MNLLVLIKSTVFSWTILRISEAKISVWLAKSKMGLLAKENNGENLPLEGEHSG